MFSGDSLSNLYDKESISTSIMVLEGTGCGSGMSIRLQRFHDRNELETANDSNQTTPFLDEISPFPCASEKSTEKKNIFKKPTSLTVH